MLDINIVLCKYHVSNLNDAVKSRVDKDIKDDVLSIVQTMIYCSDEFTFNECLEALPSGNFKTYFIKNWLGIEEMWANHKQNFKTLNFVLLP